MTAEAAPGAGADAAYRAFLSYSHRDRAIADWLHRRLERFVVPAKLVGRPTPVGPAPRRLSPIFRDREELAASGDLGAVIESALARSLFLVVICSPAAARSRWVDQEILRFKQLHGEERVLALIVAGEPNGSSQPEMEEQECFPPSLRKRLVDGVLIDQPAEPIAADFRPEGDGKRLALLKIVAGLAAVPLDALVQREAQRRTRRMGALVAASLAVAVTTGGLALYANQQRTEALAQREVAREEAATSRQVANFMIGTFSLRESATENPYKLTAVTMLDRVSRRARVELAGKPAIQARLAAAFARAYVNLSLPFKARDVLRQNWREIEAAGADGIAARLAMADLQRYLGDFRGARQNLASARAALGPDPATNPRALSDIASGEAMVFSQEGDAKGMLRAFGQARDYLAMASDVRPEEMASMLSALGIALSADGQFDEARTVQAQALVLSRNSVGENHSLTGAIETGIAQNERRSGRIAEADRAISEALRIARLISEPDDPLIADLLVERGQIRQALHQLPLAEPDLEKAIAIYRKTFKRPHFTIGIAEVDLALVLRDKGQYEPALRLMDDARHNYDVGYGGLHANHGDLLVNRATILARAGRLREARADCAAGLDILGRTIGKDADFTVKMAKLCADTLGPPVQLR